ncbi:hypothetical protein F5Y19DRAFT_474775 [Xylariaceae sp. FL1651]|nr:hypothetical protein F5Y19DRAFT_474775 [Xylariaceae sp. FL1651]
MLSPHSFASPLSALGLFTVLSHVEAQSFQYVFNNSLPIVNATAQCSNALSRNISCDPWVSRFRPGVYYDPNGLQKVCTSSCQKAIQDYTTGLSSDCNNLTYNYTDTTSLPVAAIGSRLLYNYNLVCLQDSGRYCNYVAYEASLQADPDAPAILGKPSGNQTISNCDTCIVKQLQLQAGSPFDGGDNLAADYSSLTSSCSITGMPVTTTTLASSTMSITDAPSPTCAGKTYQVSAGDTCRSIAQSQGISVGWLVVDNGLNAYCAGFNATGSLCIQNTCKTYIVKTNDTCASIAKAQNVTQTQLVEWNPILDSTCKNIGLSLNDSICVGKPGKPFTSPTTTIPVVTSITTAASVPTDVAANTTHNCGLFYQVQLGDYCNIVCIKFNINLDDFLFLNPSVNSNCTNLFAQESYCVAPVGDLSDYPGHPGYVPPNSATPSSAWSSAPTATWIPPVLNITDDAPLANGTRSDCWSFTNGNKLQIPINGTFYSSTCQLIAQTYGISLEQLQNWNPSLDTNGTDCMFESNLRYCVLAYNPVQTSDSGPVQTATPDLIRDGTWQNCTAYLDVNFGMTCQAILDNYGLTIDQFSTWNPEVGKQCENLWENYRYCVSLTQSLDEAGGSAGGGSTSITATPTVGPTTSSSSSATTTTSTGVAAPSPTQDNSIVSNCNKYAIAVKGDYCYIFAQEHGITTDQLYAWNAVLGVGGANCGTMFWLDYYYCIGVSS